MSQIKITVNEKYLKLVPRPKKEEYTVLLESLLSNGQREPIIVNESGEILDGHTRYEILSERGININAVTKTFTTKEEEELYVIDCNLARRHLNSFQKIQLVYTVYLTLKQQMGRGGDNRNKIKTGGASAVIGKTIGVNRNYVQMGAWLIDNATAKIIGQLERGVLSIDAAYKIMNDRDKKMNNKNRPTLSRLLKYFEGDPEKKILLENMIREFDEGIRK